MEEGVNIMDEMKGGCTDRGRGQIAPEVSVVDHLREGDFAFG